MELKGFVYTIGKLDAFKKLHVARKLAPLLGAVTGMQKSGIAASFEQFAGPIAQALAAMPDQEVEQVIGTCLAVVRRKLPRDAGWVPIWNTQAQAPQFEDIDLPEMLQLVFAVVQENLGGFLPESLGALPSQAAPPA